jgi:hypothetical protein
MLTDTARTEDCKMGENGKWCSFQQVTSLTLLPARQPVELLIKGPGDELMGSLRITLDALTVSCLPSTEGWLRSYTIGTMMAKRCPAMGSCSGDACSKVAPDSVIPELAEANHAPGVTRCTESCSVWWCGCAMPPTVASLIKGCLFYRFYAKPYS